MYRHQSTLFIILFLAPFICIAQHWQTEQVVPLPEGITNNAVASGEISGQPYIYTFGGIDSTKSYSGIHQRSYRYHLGAQQWERIADLPDTLGSIAASASRVKDIIYIIGGYHVFANGNEKSSTRVHRYDIKNNQYLTDGTAIPIAIDDQVQAVWRDSLIYVVTGWSENRNVLNVQIYNPGLNSWSAGTSLPSGTYAAFGASGEILGDTIYFYGGARSSGGFPISALFRKGIINPDNPTEIEWSVELVPNSEVGYRAGAAIVQEKVYWLGGAEQTYNFDGLAYSNNQGVPPSNRSLRYDPVTNTWDVDRTNFLPMDLRNVAQVNDTTLYLVGGMTANQTVTKEVLKLTANPIRTSNNNLVTKLDKLHLYPNPGSTHLQVILANDENRLKKLSVYNTKGQVIFSTEFTTNRCLIDRSTWPRGMYFLKITQELKQWSGKILVN